MSSYVGEHIEPVPVCQINIEEDQAVSLEPLLGLQGSTEIHTTLKTLSGVSAQHPWLQWKRVADRQFELVLDCDVLPDPLRGLGSPVRIGLELRGGIVHLTRSTGYRSADRDATPVQEALRRTCNRAFNSLLACTVSRLVEERVRAHVRQNLPRHVVNVERERERLVQRAVEPHRPTMQNRLVFANRAYVQRCR